ncbi:MAG: AbrB/MazE/SpoVT family DNA-binding domain-containing protein [Chloroflexi bacterium]|nr:AbrB/MazE/SpoVT family DNA-binding domain-containing protein [Chloroflexota bacterium]
MSRTLVAVNAQGRVTLPADVRRKLHLAEGSQLEVAVEAGRITLRPAQVIPADDAWAYTPEHRASVRRALEDVKAGRVYRLTSKEWDDIVNKGRLPARVRRGMHERRAAKRKST